MPDAGCLVTFRHTPVSVVPRDKLGRCMTTFEFLPRNTHLPIRLRTRCKTNLVVVAPEVFQRQMRAELDVSKKAERRFRGDFVEYTGDVLDLFVVGSHTKANKSVRSRKAVENNADRTLDKKLEILSEFAERSRTDKERLLTIRFLVSPVEIVGDAQGKVTGLRLVKNELYRSANGSLRPRPTERFEELPAELVFRSVGYRGVPLAGLPFDERSGIVPNEKGRVRDSAADQPMRGVYVSGWIKRGPTGVIGTNKPDAAETVASMLADLHDGRILEPALPNPRALLEHVCRTRPEFVSNDGWLHLKEIEEGRGKPQGRPRVKLTSVDEMLGHLDDRPCAE